MDDALVRALFAPFARFSERPFVVAQLGQSLDGRIATVTGASRSIGGAAALEHLHRLRAHVDAVVVGIGTVLADDPQLTTRLVQGRSPARVVIDPSGRLPPTARCLDGGCFVVCRAGTILPDGALPIRLDEPQGMISPSGIVEALFARGFRRILIEGGARTISRFIDAGCIDRLHVAVAPMIIGSGKPGLELRPIEALSQALRPATAAYVLEDGNVLFDCDLRSPGARTGE
jgi:riboflavin-specific deaminase-like protein